VVPFPQVSPSKPCIRLSSPQFALHAAPVSFFSIWSPGQYLRSAKHETFLRVLSDWGPFCRQKETFWTLVTCTGWNVANNYKVGRPLLYATESATDPFWKWRWADSKSDNSVRGYAVYAHTSSIYRNFFFLISCLSKTNTSIIVECDKVYCGAYWQTSQWNTLLSSTVFKLFAPKTGTQKLPATPPPPPKKPWYISDKIFGAITHKKEL